jgi:hypothetical protein
MSATSAAAATGAAEERSWVLLSAGLHSFAVHYATERAEAVDQNPWYDRYSYDLIVDIADYHRGCLSLLEKGEYNGYFFCDEGSRTHEEAELMFARLAREHPGDKRYDDLSWHHALAQNVLDDDPVDFPVKGKGKSKSKANNFGDKGKGNAEKSGGKGKGTFDFWKGYMKGYLQGEDDGFVKGYFEGKAKGKEEAEQEA